MAMIVDVTRMAAGIGHRCDPKGKRVGLLQVPTWCSPGEPVRVIGPGEPLYGRARLVWRCCGTVVVEHLVSPDDSPDTVSTRYLMSELEAPVWGESYAIPCIGAEWSVNLTCGHLAGEGCDCDLIALEAADQG